MTQPPHISELESYCNSKTLDKPTIGKKSASALYYYHNQFMRTFSHVDKQISFGAEIREWIYLGRANTLGDGRDSVDYLSPFYEISESPHLSNVTDVSI